MNLNTLTLIIVVCIGLGTLFLVAASVTSAKISRVVPQTLRNRWFILLALIIFFIAGYIFFLFSFLFSLPISTALLTGIVFLAGAVFVVLVINLAKATIFQMFEDDKELSNVYKQLKSYSETLDTKVKDRTAELTEKNVQLKRERLKAQKYLDVAGTMMIALKADGEITLINKQGCKILNLSEKEAIGTNWFDNFLPKEIVGNIKGVFNKLMAGEIEPVEFYENKIKTSDGIERIVAFHNALLTDEHGVINGVLFSGEDITERKQAEAEREKLIVKLQKALDEIKEYEAKFKEMALYDPLTNLPNRRLFADRLNMILEHNRRYKGIFSVLYLDLDDFKKVNDSFGHQTGDELLCEVAKRLKKVIRKTDTIARLGGDEFVIIIDQLASAKDAEVVAEKLITTLASTFQLKKASVNVGASIGISLFPSDSDKAEELIRLADKAMYKSKSKGKNRYTFCCGDTNS